MNTLREALDRANPNSIPNALQALPAGRAFSILPVFVRAVVTANVLTLPDNAKAAQILRAYGVTGSVGNKTVAAPESTPGAGTCAVDQVGNIVFGDAVTLAEVYYIPYEGEVVEEDLPVAASAAAIPAGGVAALVISATVTSGIIPGAKIIDDRATAPATLHAALSAAGTGVAFNASDVVAGFARVKYIRRPDVSLSATLDLTVNF